MAVYPSAAITLYQRQSSDDQVHFCGVRPLSEADGDIYLGFCPVFWIGKYPMTAYLWSRWL